MNALQAITERRDNAAEQYRNAGPPGNGNDQAVWHARREAYDNCLQILGMDGVNFVVNKAMTVDDVARLADAFSMQLVPKFKHIDEPMMLNAPRDEASIDNALNTLPGRLWMAYTARHNTITSVNRKPGISRNSPRIRRTTSWIPVLVSRITPT